MLEDGEVIEDVLLSGCKKEGKNQTYHMYEICKVKYIIWWTYERIMAVEMGAIRGSFTVASLFVPLSGIFYECGGRNEREIDHTV